MKHNRLSLDRRSFLSGLCATVVGGSLLSARDARAQAAHAQRVIFFYFPDGVPGPSSNGESSAWHPTGGPTNFSLPDVLSPLNAHRDDCVFFRGLSMGATDVGSHPGGAKKLLTASDGGSGWSLDHALAQGVGADAPHRHVYLGAMATENGASGDKHIVYVNPGQTIAPEDSPLAAFARLFPDGVAGGGVGGGVGGGAGTPNGAAVARRRRKRSILDGALAEVQHARSALGGAQASKLDFHLDSLRELEARLAIEAEGMPPPTMTGACSTPNISEPPGGAFDPARFPAVLRAQIDTLIAAMGCGLTRVGTIQCSHHTSELNMAAFMGTEMYIPNYSMRSHQASHYGPAHDLGANEYGHFVKQRRWFVEQFAYLLAQLKARPEGDGTMLDHTVVLLCTEVCDGNTHGHDDMPFILAGRAGGRISTGRLIDAGFRRHGSLLTAIGQAMGASMPSYGDGEPALPGLLSG